MGKDTLQHNIFEDRIWEAIEVNEDGNTWYEVHLSNSTLVVTDSTGLPAKFNKRRALSIRDAKRREDTAANTRTEKVVRE